MKTLFAAVLLFGSSFAWAAQSPAEYTVNVHVISSHIDEKAYSTPVGQILRVLINGKKYELEGDSGFIVLDAIAPGDYKARVVREKHRGTYADAVEYELLFPDQTTAKFDLIGESE